MAIVPGQLIAAAMLQDLLVDKLGEPLVDGIVTCYQDNSRTTLKNWYYQSGTPGNYTYIPLPNPMTLSAAGTIVDVNGNDTIPFWYPYSETDNTVFQPYFITIFDQNGQLQFTRSNFPYVPNQGGITPVSVETLENYVINNRFWRNIGPGALSITSGGSWNTGTWTTQFNTTGNYPYVTLAPSNHDGFSMPDFVYVKNANTATETIQFKQFPGSLGPIFNNDIAPEYYINHNCTGLGVGETIKCYQFPISLHLNNLVGEKFTFTIQGQSISGASTITVLIYQFQGTGVTSTTSPIGVSTITLGSGWAKYELQGQFPSTSGLTLPSQTGDDAYYLQIMMPTNEAFNLNFTLPSIYLGTEVPTNSFQTYDEIDTIISDPRTGDVRTSINSFYPFGWLPMNDGVIGLTNPGTNAQYVRANSDVWPLWQLLWAIGKQYDVSMTPNPILQMYTNTAGTLATTNYGASAYADFIYNNTGVTKALTLPFAMGQVFLGTVPLSALLPASPTYIGYTSSLTTATTVATLTDNQMGLFNGAPATFIGISALSANVIYYVGNIATSSSVPTLITTFSVYLTFENALTNTSPITLGTVSSGATINYGFAGFTEGEYAHTQQLSELAQHTHNAPAGAADYLVNQSGGGAISGSGFLNSAATVTGTVTNYVGTAANVTQPGTFMNIYIKL